jgi:hypothetical protein
MQIAFVRKVQELSRISYSLGIEELQAAVASLAKEATHDSQRIMVAKVLMERHRIDANTKAKRIRASQEELRKSTERGQKKPCYVCGQFQVIAQLHHIVSVKQMAEILFENHSLVNLPMLTVWLCPNHHAWWHWKERQEQRGWTIQGYGLTSEEIERFTELTSFAEENFWRPVQKRIAEIANAQLTEMLEVSHDDKLITLT